MVASPARLLLFLSLSACGQRSEPDPMDTPEGKACDDAHTAMVDATRGMFERRGTPEPGRWPDRSMFVQRCLDLELTPKQYACLDPLRAQQDPRGCAAILGPVKRDVDAFSRWFNAELRRGLSVRPAGVQTLESGGTP